jgi:hypothetical protein
MAGLNGPPFSFVDANDRAKIWRSREARQGFIDRTNASPCQADLRGQSVMHRFIPARNCMVLEQEHY